MICAIKRIAFLIIFLDALISAQTFDKLIITEVMFRPHGTNNEFIEIFNPSTVNSINIKGIKIQYYKSKPDIIDTTLHKLILPPKTYAVIFEGDYSFSAGTYSALIPKNSLQLKINDNAFGTSGMSNSSDRKILLLDANNDTLDTYTYTANNKEGISDERIFVDSLHLNNAWENSLNDNGTPGFRNSVSPLDHNIGIVNISFSAPRPSEDKLLKLNIIIKNIGLFHANNFTVSFYDDLNKDSIPDYSELLFQRGSLQLNSFDSLTLSFEKYFNSGTHFFIAKALYPSDEDTSNNILFKHIYVSPLPNKYNDIVINEIMYNPSEGTPEWVELFNNSKRTIVLNGWKLTDETTTATISTNSISLNPASYLVIADDSLYLRGQPSFNYLILNLPSLNNSSDKIILLDSSGVTIDSVFYSKTRGGSRGKSLERISANSASNQSANWGSSMSRFNSTPGRVNSLTPKNFDLSIEHFSSVSPFNLLNTDLKLRITILNKGNKINGPAALSVYLDANRDSIGQPNELLLKKPVSAIYSNDSLKLLLTLTGLPLGKNLLLAQINFPDDQFPDNDIAFTTVKTVKINETKGDIVINEIMYAPVNNQPEWIELFNASGKIINLKNYLIGDDRSLKLVIKNNLLLQPGGYLVVAKDSNFFNFHNVNPVVIANFPSLNNSGDAVVIKDSLNRTIDSVSYSSQWGGSKGNSLERIFPHQASLDSSNWAECYYPTGSTPCSINSVSPKTFDLELSEIFTENKYVPKDSSLTIYFLIKNRGSETASNAVIDFFNDLNNNNQPEGNELLRTFNLPALPPKDSALLNCKLGKLPTGKNLIIAELHYTNDENHFNNKAYLTIQSVNLNIFKGDIVFNEIMYAPPANQPEWIELFNNTNKNFPLIRYVLSDGRSQSVFTSKIKSASFLVIAKDSSLLNYFNIDSNIVIADFPTLNNNGDIIILRDSLGRIIDSLKYSPSWGGNGGYSLERISSVSNTNDSSNWATSVAFLKATPGKINSVSQKDYDLKILKFYAQPPIPQFKTKIKLFCNLKNIGKNTITFRLKLLLSKDNKIFSSVFLSDNITLLPEASFDQPLGYSLNKITNTLFLKLIAIAPEDQDVSNNIDSLILSPIFPKHSLVINEIMFNPYDGPEWFELFNNTVDTINIRNWKIADVLSRPDTSTICDFPSFVLPSEYLVVAKDSSFFDYHKTNGNNVIINIFANLNNRKDGLKLLDATNNLIDSVFYDDSYFRSGGRSIERVSPESSSTDYSNWKASQNKYFSTPGFINSVSPKKYDVTIDSVFTNPNYPQREKDFSILAAVKNNGSENVSNLPVMFYVKTGSAFVLFDSLTIHSLNNNERSLVNGDKSLNIKDSVVVKALVKLADDQDTTNNYIIKTITVNNARGRVFVSEFNPRPDSHETQWIELANVSNEKISLNNWKIQTDSKYLRFKSSSHLPVISPNSYFVISRDTLTELANYANFLILPALKLKYHSDQIRIIDFRGEPIDSLRYSDNWNIVKGHSVEKINLTASSADSTNWFFSLDNNNSTAGRINSVSELKDFPKNSCVINEIMFNPLHGNAEYIEIVNPSENTANLGGWQLLISGKKRFFVSLNNHTLTSNSYYVVASDSSIFYTFNYLSKEKTTITNTGSLSIPNSGTSVVLEDAFGNIIDSLSFLPAWHNKNILNTSGKSLERINPELNSNDPFNWSTCVAEEGGTPGKVNSVFINNTNSTSAFTISPNPFSPDNDGYEDFTIFSFKLKAPESQVIIRIFDDNGRLVRTLVNNRTFSSKGSVVFNGLDDEGNLLRMGVYLVLLQAVNVKNNELQVLKGIVVLAHKLN